MEDEVNNIVSSTAQIESIYPINDKLLDYEIQNAAIVDLQNSNVSKGVT